MKSWTEFLGEQAIQDHGAALVTSLGQKTAWAVSMVGAERAAKDNDTIDGYDVWDKELGMGWRSTFQGQA